MSTLTVGTISEKVTDAGVSVDGVTLKDGELGTSASPVAINSSSLNGGQFGGRRNIVINGAMQVAQRGTSVTSISTEGYKTVDRFKWTMDNTSAVFTHSQSTDVPTGEGFGNSFKVDVTTADTSLASGNQTRFEYRFEGQDVQQLAKGTSNAKKVTLSFWVKAYQTGTYVVNIHDTDNSRLIAKTYTVNSSATWEYKTITFDGDTTGTLNNDNNLSLVLHWYLGAGSDYTSGTLATSWESFTNANRAVGQTVDIATSTSNYWQITGIQMEVGEQATPFEHRSFGEELGLCQRYYFENVGKNFGGIAPETNRVLVDGLFPQRMRTSPTLTAFSNDGTTGKCSRSLDNSNITVTSFNGQSADGIHQILGTFVQNAGYYLGVKADAEL